MEESCMKEEFSSSETITIEYEKKQKELYMADDPRCIYPQWHSRVGIHSRGRNFAAMVARKYCEDKGYSVLKGYYLMRCPRLRETNEGFITICRIFGKEKMLRFLTAARHLRGGDPDLFVYRPDYSECFFVEAKAEGDKLNENQLQLIPIIRKLLCPVYIALIRCRK